MSFVMGLVNLVYIPAESDDIVTQVDNAHNPPKVKNVSFPTWNRLEPSWNRRGTVLRIAFCRVEPSGTVVEPSRNRRICCVFTYSWRIPRSLIIILYKERGTLS